MIYDNWYFFMLPTKMFKVRIHPHPPLLKLLIYLIYIHTHTLYLLKYLFLLRINKLSFSMIIKVWSSLVVDAKVIKHSYWWC